MQKILIFIAGLILGAGAFYLYLPITDNIGTHDGITANRECHDQAEPPPLQSTANMADRAGLTEPPPPQKITVEVGGHRMTMDSGYFGPDIPASESVSHIVLWLTYPEPGPAGNGPADLQVLVKEPSFKDNVEYLVGAKKRTSQATKKTEDQYGLAHYIPPAQSRKQREDMFIERGENGKVVNMIACQLETASANPRCYHYYNSSGLLHMLVYGREFLPEWKSIKGDVSAFLASVHEASDIVGTTEKENTEPATAESVDPGDAKTGDHDTVDQRTGNIDDDANIRSGGTAATETERQDMALQKTDRLAPFDETVHK